MPKMPFVLEKIISGGQTGADRGGLLAARDLFLATGGWAPAGWLAEDGAVPEDLRVGMQTTPSADYAVRTKKNVEEADATVILHQGKLGPGSSLTARLAIAAKKFLWVERIFEPHQDRLQPIRALLSAEDNAFLDREAAATRPLRVYSWGGYALVDVDKYQGIAMDLADMLAVRSVKVLNVAGPRESHAPGLQERVRAFLRDLVEDERRADFVRNNPAWKARIDRTAPTMADKKQFIRSYRRDIDETMQLVGLRLLMRRDVVQ